MKSFRSKFLSTLIAFLVTTLCGQSVQGHHAASAVFEEEIIEIQGIVKEFNFVNPHVNIVLDVTDENGTVTEWMATAPAPQSLRRTGWRADSIDVGQTLRISGFKSRNNRPMILAENEFWDEGLIIELNPVDGSVIGSLLASADNVRSPFDRSPRAAQLSDGRPSLSGTWVRDRNSRGESVGQRNPPFNELGALIQTRFDAINDPAFTDCAANGLVRQARSQQPISVTQYEDRVQFSYEGGGAQRILYLDEHGPAGIVETALGQSVTRYEGDTLIVETTQLLGNLTGTRGNALSKKHTTVETYRRVDDENGPALQFVMVITDPEYLAEPWEMSWVKYYAAADYVPTLVDCRLPYEAVD
jgi:hypothetical protein